jgi:8-oxo-dGTP diphosphatase
MDKSTNATQHRQVSIAILIDSHGRFLLQQRDDIPGIIHPGKIGLFGGHREGVETYLQCVVREIHEEIGYFIQPDRFEHFASYDEVGDHGTDVHGEIFAANNIPVEELLVTEGLLLVVEPEDVPAIEANFSPSARFAIKRFFDESRSSTNKGSDERSS